MSARLIQFLITLQRYCRLQQVYAWHACTIESLPVIYNSILLTTEHCFWSGNAPGMRHHKYECNSWHWFRQICSALILVPVASTLAIRTWSKLNRCETTSRRWFSLIRIKLLIRISWCSVNARMGAKPVSLRIKSASVNGVLDFMICFSDGSHVSVDTVDTPITCVFRTRHSKPLVPS